MDAAPRGIEIGYMVRLYNERDAVFGVTYVIERIIPGAVYQDHGTIIACAKVVSGGA